MLLQLSLLSYQTGVSQNVSKRCGLIIQQQIQAVEYGHTFFNIGQLLERDLLDLACRHHVLEVVLAAAFKATTSETSNPEVLLLAIFQAGWGNIEQDKFQHGTTDGIVNILIEPIKDELLVFDQSQLDINEPRDDYRELIEFCYFPRRSTFSWHPFPDTRSNVPFSVDE